MPCTVYLYAYVYVYKRECLIKMIWRAYVSDMVAMLWFRLPLTRGRSEVVYGFSVCHKGDVVLTQEGDGEVTVASGEGAIR